MDRRISKIKKKKNHEISLKNGLLLSILISCSLKERKKLQFLSKILQEEIEDNNLKFLVEIISHLNSIEDNKEINKNNMVKASGGKFFVILNVLEGKDFQLKEAIEKILDNIEYYTLDIGSKNLLHSREDYLKSEVFSLNEK